MSTTNSLTNLFYDPKDYEEWINALKPVFSEEMLRSRSGFITYKTGFQLIGCFGCMDIDLQKREGKYVLTKGSRWVEKRPRM